jgi:hypothetical protein
MNWYKISQMESLYGYWLKPNGELITVKNQEHVRILRELLDPQVKLSLFDLYQEAFHNGWIRLAIEQDRISMQYDKTKGITQNQQNTIRSLYIEGYKHNRFNFSMLIDYSDAATSGTYVNISNPVELNQFFEKKI